MLLMRDDGEPRSTRGARRDPEEVVEASSRSCSKKVPALLVQGFPFFVAFILKF